MRHEIEKTAIGRECPHRFVEQACWRLLATITSRRMLVSACAVCLGGCASVAQVTNLSQPACAAEFRQGMSAILVEQGETSGADAALAEQTLSTLATGALGPRPFLVASTSGTDYEFFVEKKSGQCLLHLYGRQHGFVSYTNNLTWIATRPLTGCECAE